MVLGAALICNDDLEKVRKGMSKLTTKVGKKDIHCNKLSHSQKKFICRSLATAPITLFGVISKKHTLGTYKDKIDASHTMYYNKCASYLLEVVGKHQLEKGISPDLLDIVFEEGGYDYAKLRNLIRQSIKTPFHKNAENLAGIDPDRIVSKEKGDEALLEVADVVAHAIYKCTDKSEKMHGIPEAQYMSELLDKFYHHPKTGYIWGNGVKAVHDVKSLDLDEDVVRVIERNFNKVT